MGVVIAEPTGRIFGDPFFVEVLRGISTGLAAREMQELKRKHAEAEQSKRPPHASYAGVDGRGGVRHAYGAVDPSLGARWHGRVASAAR